MLVAENIYLDFKRPTLPPTLQNVSLKIGKGEIIGIVGKSGAGKTSLLKILCGMLEPTSGTVELEGEKVAGPLIKLVPGHPEIQLVNQDFHLDTYHTVEENIREQVMYLPLKERDSLVDELLILMELEEIRTQKAVTLSGGEQQRLALARALACEPKVLLLDEPFVHMDGRLRSKLTNYLLQMRNIRGTSLVLVSHDGSEMLSLADSIILLKKGSIARIAKPKAFYYKPRTIEDAKLFGAINSVKINEKRIIFRPDEYEISSTKTEDSITLKFERALFTGPVYENYFTTLNKEKVVLYSFKNLEYVSQITIKK